jgi:AcrR family transcriptional regulator
MTSGPRVDRAPAVQRSRLRSAQQQKAIVDAARRLVDERGSGFTTQELIAEAGIALQTFYRYFGGKDQLLLAVIEDLIGEAAVALEEQAQGVPNPADRLRFYITSMLQSVGPGNARGPAQFVTSEHWRLHQLFPDEVARASQPIVDLFARELRAATDTGRFHSTDPTRDAWFTMRLVMSTFHHFAFVTTDPRVETVAEELWSFLQSGYGAST